jgi:hypothetical protein
MTRFRRLRGILAAVALAAGIGAAPAPGQAFVGSAETQFVAVWLRPGLGLAAPDRPALLTLPPGWISGDAMVVLAPAGDWPAAARARLATDMLEAGAGVLDLGAGGAAPLAEDLAAALRVALVEQGAGLVVLIGRGATGDTALSAAGQGYAAAIRLGPGEPGLRFFPAAPAEAWPMRAWLLCGLLAGAAGESPGFAEACRAGAAQLR